MSMSKETELRAALGSILTNLLGTSSNAELSAFAEISGTPQGIAALDALSRRDIRAFEYALPYPVNQVVQGALSTAFPNNTRVQFMFAEGEFVARHIRKLIESFEGAGCAADKTRTVQRAVLDYLLDGTPIAFNYNQQYTYHLPKRVFTKHDSTLKFFEGLYRMYYGDAEEYLAGLTALHADLLPAPESS